MTKHSPEEGIAVLKKMARVNGEDLAITKTEKDDLKAWVEQNKAKMMKRDDGIINLFQKRFLKTTIITSLLWFTTNFVYYGMTYLMPMVLESISYESPDASEGTIFELAFPIFGEIAAIFLGALLVENPWFGRRRSVILGFLVSMISCIGIYFTRYFITLSLVGKAGIALSFAIVYPLCNELYPT